jgi:hypothetical protein
VHKAGEERRFGATPATATPLPSSCKARDPVRRKARPLRVRARRKTTGGPRQSPRSECLPPARSSKFMFVRMSGASAGFCGRRAIRGKARGPAVGAKRRLPGPGKTKVPSAGGSRLSPRSGRQARPVGVEGAPAGRTGAGVNRPTVRTRNAAPEGDCNREGGRGNTGWQRCTKPVRSDASARPRRLQRR